MPPEVLEGTEAPWRAWNDLNSERHWKVAGYSVPMGGTMIQSSPGPIPWSAIQAWCDRAHGLGDGRDFVLHLVAAMDREFITHWHRQQNKPRAAPIDDKLSRWDQAEG